MSPTQKERRVVACLQEQAQKKYDSESEEERKWRMAGPGPMQYLASIYDKKTQWRVLYRLDMAIADGRVTLSNPRRKENPWVAWKQLPNDAIVGPDENLENEVNIL